MTPLVALVVAVLAGIMAADLVRQARSRTWSARRHRRALDTLRRITTQRPEREAVRPMAAEAEATRQAHVRILSPGYDARCGRRPGEPLDRGPADDPTADDPTAGLPIDLRSFDAPSDRAADAHTSADPIGFDLFDDDPLDSRLLDAVFGARPASPPTGDPNHGAPDDGAPDDGAPDDGDPDHVDPGDGAPPAPEQRRRSRRPATTAAATVVAGMTVVALGALGVAHLVAGDRVGHAQVVRAVTRPARHQVATSPRASPSTATTIRTPPPVTLISSSPGTSLYHLAAATTRISFAADGLCWIEIRRTNADGPVIYSEALTAGRTESVLGPVWVRLGNPTAIVIRAGGTAVLPAFASGQPYDLEFE